MGMERKVIHTAEIEDFVYDLTYTLFQKKYFSFLEDAQQYVNNLFYYVKKYIGILPGKDAPSYFNSYGENLKYITYQSNKATTWYIFYQQEENVFLICYISNNHFEGKYFNL